MDLSTNTKPMKPNSNISEMVCKFAKVCKLKSIGVFSSEIPNNLHHLHRPICNETFLSENTNEEFKCYDHKVYPHPIEVVTKEGSCAGLDVMTKIFDGVSALKLAYLQLQQAHIPYNTQKIVAADDVVVAELEKLCKFKREYKEKQLKKAKINAELSDLLLAEIVAKEAFLGKLKPQNSVKDSVIVRFRRELQDLEMGNKSITEKMKQIRFEKRKSIVMSVTKFQDVFKAASKSIHDFAKPLISLMKVSGWDLDKAVKSIEIAAVYSKRCDKKYAFEAYIARRMFHGIALTSYDVSDVMKFDDPFDALIENPHSEFAKFCQAKYLLLVHPKMEESFFGNLDHRTLIMNGKHPRTEFYQLFAKMAKWIWVLLGSAVSIDRDATMFSVSIGSTFSSLYMESVEESAILSSKSRTTDKVQFMIMPGFKVGQTLVKSRVYVSQPRSS